MRVTRRQSKSFGEYTAMVCIWLGLLLLFSLVTEHFFTARTLGSIANRIPTLTVVATGMTLVLIVGGIDLSVGSVLGLCGAVLGAAIVSWDWPVWAAAALSVLTGLAAGSLNGLISVKLNIPSFIVTLGMLEIARGLAYLVTRSQTKYIGAPIEGLSRPLSVSGVSWAFFLAILIVFLAQVVLTRTVWGRLLVAIGTNESAVRLSGLNPRPAKIAVFAVIGLLTGVAGLFHASRLGSADPNAGVGLELSAIAAVVIGGTSLMGGRGSVVSSFFGVLIIATLEAGLAQVGATEPVKRVVTGAVIVVAVVLDAWRHRIGRSRFAWLSRHLKQRSEGIAVSLTK